MFLGNEIDLWVRVPKLLPSRCKSQEKYSRVDISNIRAAPQSEVILLVPEIISASTFANLMEPVYLLITILWEFASFPFAKPFQDFGLVLFFGKLIWHEC